jgi:hypothetical protein
VTIARWWTLVVIVLARAEVVQVRCSRQGRLSWSLLLLARVCCVALSETLVAIGTTDDTIHVFDAASGKRCVRAVNEQSTLTCRTKSAGSSLRCT